MPVDSVERAAALVLASDSRFAGIGPRHGGLIGQSTWYEASATTDGYAVAVRIGWGDCPSGCIDEHRWHYAVTPDGEISLEGQTGEPVPAGVRPPPMEGEGTLMVELLAGPTCPVETVPPEPGCDPRRVADATVVIRDAEGLIVAEPVSDEAGMIEMTLPAGVYVLEPSEVDDFLGQAQPALVWVHAGRSSLVTVAYDTGIR